MYYTYKYNIYKPTCNIGFQILHLSLPSSCIWYLQLVWEKALLSSSCNISYPIPLTIFIENTVFFQYVCVFLAPWLKISSLSLCGFIEVSLFCSVGLCVCVLQINIMLFWLPVASWHILKLAGPVYLGFFCWFHVECHRNFMNSLDPFDYCRPLMTWIPPIYEYRVSCQCV